MDTNIDKVFSILNNIKGYEKISTENSNLKRLGGMTNIVHLVETENINLIVRIPGKGTEDYINRTFEYNNAMAAWRAGISAEIIWADVERGIMVSKAINGIETMTPNLFSTRKGSPARAGLALAKLHNSGETFDFRFDLFNMIDEYLKILSSKNAELPDGYHEIVDAAKPVKEALIANPTL